MTERKTHSSALLWMGSSLFCFMVFYVGVQCAHLLKELK